MRSVFKNISWRAIRVWQRNFDVYLKTWKVNFVPPLLEPIFYLFAFGLGVGNLVTAVTFEGRQVPYLQFIAPGLIAVTTMNHGFFETSYASFVRMYFQKTYDAILSTPLTIEDVVLGELIWAATKSVFAALIMFAVAMAMGLLSFPNASWILPVCLIAGMVFASLGMCFTAMVRTIEMFNLPVFLFVTPMFLFCGVFFPLASLPSWIQHVAWLLPMTHLVSALRTISLGGMRRGILIEIFVLILMALVFPFLSIVMMKRRILK